MIDKVKSKRKRAIKRKLRSKKNIISSATRPRLVVFRSNKYLYVQVIDDTTSKVVVSSSSVAKGLKDKKLGKNVESAKVIGTDIATKLKAKKIKTIVFDRNGYLYHGKVKALADACREAGIKF
jgi:large subunit ribosomal protein L18